MNLRFGSALPKELREEIRPLSEEFEALREEDAERIQRFRDYRKENELTRNADIFGQVADTTDYGRNKTHQVPQRHNIPLPFGLAATIKHGHRIFGRLPDVTVDRREETERERYRSDTMEKIIWAIIRASGDATPFKDAAWDGSQLGASCFDTYWHPYKQLPIIRAIDPEGILVVPGVDNPHDYERVYRFWEVSTRSLKAKYGGKKFRDVDIPLSSLTKQTCTLVQVTDRERTLRFAIDGFETDDDIEALPLWEKRHGLGFVNYVVIPNIGPEREMWGWADYELIRGLVHYIPTHHSREADLLRATAGGAYLEKGTGQSPGRILNTIRQGGIIPSKREGEVTPVETPKIPDFAVDHADRSLLMMKMLGFLPDAAWGDGAAGSGSDRGLQLQPLLELTAMKQSNWSSGLTRLFETALRMMEKRQSLPTSYSGYQMKGQRRVPFILPRLGPQEEPGQIVTGVDEEGVDVTEQLPRTLKELFAGDYCANFSWQNRIDPDDPAYVNSELSKFQMGAQSLRTTLERLGVQNPEDEIRLIAQEVEKYPWINQGAIALVKAQLQAEQSNGGQGDGGGAPTDPTSGLFDAQDSFASADTSATDADFAARAAGAGSGPLYGRS